MPDKNNLSSYDDMSQNPFASILQRASGGSSSMAAGPSQGQAQGQEVPPQTQTPMGAQGQTNPQELPPEQEQLMRGKNPSNSKFLITAIQSLENYVQGSEDKDEIATARSVISLLTRLIDRNQQSMSSGLMG